MRKNMPASALDNPFARQQKMLLYLMPIFFAISGVNFPIGVLLYWLVTNVWSMCQQFYVIRKMPAPGSKAEQALRTARPRRARSHEEFTVKGLDKVDDEPPAKPTTGQRQQPTRKKKKKTPPASATGPAKSGPAKSAGQGRAGRHVRLGSSADDVAGAGQPAPDRQLREDHDRAPRQRRRDRRDRHRAASPCSRRAARRDARRRRRRRRRPATRPATAPTRRRPEPRPSRRAAAVADLEREGEVAADFLETLLDIADLDGDIDVDVDGDRAAVSIVDSDEGRVPRRLVGQDGAVLDALQELTRLAVQSATGERSRLMLDVAGHRAERRAGLVDHRPGDHRAGQGDRREGRPRPDDGVRAQGGPRRGAGCRARLRVRGHRAPPLRRRAPGLTAVSRETAR